MWVPEAAAFAGLKVPLGVAISLSPGDANGKDGRSWLDEVGPTACSGVELKAKANAGDLESYYDRFRFHGSAQQADDRWVELVVGGPTDWTQKLLNNAM